MINHDSFMQAGQPAAPITADPGQALKERLQTP